ncbi:MAG: hypothetical protein Q8R91_08435, partial [Candidatus Omnitrophota bacterium]|nr:hypothetical protein [Candidatus Omnitrophota bacterium]
TYEPADSDPSPLITTYQQLAIATGIPVERLIAQGIFAPEPQTEAEAEAAIADAATWGETPLGTQPGEEV